MEFNGAKIKVLREQRNWTKAELAEKLVDTGHFTGFTHQRVEQLEKSDNASHRALVALCKVFDCKPSEFFLQ